MRLRIHHPIFAGFVGVVGGVVVLVAALAGREFRRELTDSFHDALGQELALAAAFAESASNADPQDLAHRLTALVGHRATLIAPDGSVAGDSDVRTDRLAVQPNQSAQPDVRAALRGEVFVDEVELEDESLLFAARRITLAGQPAVLRLSAPLSTVDTAAARARRVVILAGLAGLGLAVVVAYLLSRLVVSPLVALSDRVRGLSAGDFSRRAPRGVPILELDELGAAFNRLTDELRARLTELGRERDEMQALIDAMAEGVVALTEDARILRTNRAARALLALPQDAAFAPVGAMVRHTDLRDLLEESVVKPFRAREVNLSTRHLIVSARLLDGGGSVVTFLDVSEMRRLEQVRRDFVANASHELKTPLTTIRGFAETLIEDDPPDHLRREFLASIRDNTLRLQRMVEDLLDLSRLESGTWSARRDEVDLAELARDAWSDFRERAAAASVTLDVASTALVVADEQGLRQVFRNLLENSLRYTGKGGTITIRATVDRLVVRVEVTDTGAGIPSRSLPRIFERFYRADSSRARSEGGTGLGLAIVRHLIHAMGGEIGAASELGQGTTIWFTLPLAVV